VLTRERVQDLTNFHAANYAPSIVVAASGGASLLDAPCRNSASGWPQPAPGRSTAAAVQVSLRVPLRPLVSARTPVVLYPPAGRTFDSCHDHRHPGVLYDD
jgi:hypothetical protein